LKFEAVFVEGENAMIAETLVEIPVTTGIVRRTDRGLCVANTRISLYLIMDYLKASWTPQLIRHWLGLSEEEMSAATNYIAAHQAEFEAEYTEVVKKNEEREKFYRERARSVQASAVKPNLAPEQAVALARLQALKRAGKY
jgi:uncharacterized protein (DUF433 family)